MKRTIGKKQLFTHMSNEEGFTLLESLIALFICTICLMLLLKVIQTVEKVNEATKFDKFYEWHIFLNQLEYDVNDASYVRTVPDKYVEWRTPYNTSLRYEGYYSETVKSRPELEKQLLIRRRYNGGSNPILVFLNSHQVRAYPFGVVWTVEFENGVQYSALLANSKEENKGEMNE